LHLAFLDERGQGLRIATAMQRRTISTMAGQRISCPVKTVRVRPLGWGAVVRVADIIVKTLENIIVNALRPGH
jgi:hypothetical protein